MLYAAFFLSELAITYFIGTRLRAGQPLRGLLSPLATVFVVIMVFLMGLRMGLNREILDSLGTIGLLALAVTIIVWIITVIGIAMVRRPLGISRRGDPASNKASQQAAQNSSDLRFTVMILTATAAGLLVGCFLLLPHLGAPALQRLDSLANRSILLFLALMIACIGYDMGIDGKVLREVRNAGVKILVIPLVILLFTVISGLVCGLLFPQLTIRESLSVCLGYGWYTLAPGIITAAGHEIAGAVSFLHNVFREVGGLVLIPFVAGRIGHLEAASMPGIAAMDVCLPVLLRSTRNEIIAYAFAIGMSEEIFTTVLVPMVIGA